MEYALLIIFIAYVATHLFDYCLEYLNIRHMRACAGIIPADFKEVVDAGFLEKMQRYEQEKTRFGIIASVCSSVAVLIFLFVGPLRWYVWWVDCLGLSSLMTGWLFFLLLYLGSELLSLPFTLFFVFRIEQKYGFNTMTLRLWVLDFLKGMGLGVVFLSLVVLGGLLVMDRSPGFWWFWFWCLMLAFTLFVTYISPYVIEPLFNRLEPVGDPSLRDRIIDLASRAGIRVSKVLKMDASKRSRHTNAYFTGIGRTKRIVLFDTLLEKMAPSEIMAVLAHEIGHWKRHHLLKGLVLSQTVSLALLFIAYYAVQSDLLAVLFGIPGNNLFAKIVITGFLFSIALFFLKPLANGFSRRLEREADRFSCDLQDDAETMVAVLVKLTKDNLSNLYPHPFYALFNYSHPPVLERIEQIRGYCRRSGGGAGS